MKLLRINDKKGEFLHLNEATKSTEYISLTDLSKSDILYFVDTIRNETVEKCDPITTVDNKAEEIIYKNLSVKIDKLIDEKDKINKEVEDQFKAIEEKYKSFVDNGNGENTSQE